jgi:phospholipase D1/2
MDTERKGMLTEGRNCWRTETAGRVTFLVDAAAYYQAFADTVARARQSILILGWDIDSRMRLVPGRRTDGLPECLGAFLNKVVGRRRGLHAHVLTWDFSVLFVLDREIFPVFKLGWRTHRRLHFRMDGGHPIGSSHHQKVVVVDDRVAFVGGLDLSSRRWDTPEHRAGDPRRIDAAGRPYRPVHDVQIMVDGDAAAALGDLARERWRCATGRSLRPPRPQREDPWPPHLVPDLLDVNVGIARTRPEWNGVPPVQEVKHLHLDAIAAARRHIYIENQYLTSAVIATALAERLREPDGPEVVVVLPRGTEGWLEEHTMGVLRGRALHEVRKGDRFGRLGVYHPVAPGLTNEFLHVHSKVMVIDDALVRVGSSNLSSRSMGLDTECDLAIEAGGDGRVAEGIAAFRNRLLGEHLGTAPARVAQELAARGSLLRTVEALRGGPRTLHPVHFDTPDDAAELVPYVMLVDPERPAAPDRVLEEFVPEEAREYARRPLLRLVLILALLVAATAAWRWTPLGEWIDIDTVTAAVEAVSNSPLAPLLVVGIYVVAGLFVFPVTVLIAATAFTFGPIAAFLYSLAGCLASGATTYGIGRLLGRDAIARIASPRFNRLSRVLVRRGLLTIVTVRIVPIAPYTVVNVAAGAFHIRFRDFGLGTALGLAPGILAITVFAESLERTLTDPGPVNFAILAAVLLAIAGAAFWLRRRLMSMAEGPAGDERGAHAGD